MTENTDGKLAVQLASLGAEASDALQAFTAYAQTCGTVAEDSRKKYQELLADHRVLQQELADLKNAQHVHSEGYFSDPYAIVLMDAHSHKIRDDLLKESTSGGSKAAKLLKDVVEKYLAKTSPSSGALRIIVRVYANLKSLDTDDKGSRTLAGFAAGFSREDSFFDFVDVGDEKIVKSKIVGLFKVSVKDPQCRHIFLGACRDPKYLTVLQMHSLFHEKVSYIRGSASDTGILKMPLKNAVFSQIFCTGGREESAVGVPYGIPANILQSGGCWDFQKGGCFRKDCTYKHAITWAAPSKGHDSTTISETSNRTISKHAHLPEVSVEGMIPVNAAGQRLDILMTPPSNAQWAKYTARFKTKKLCNAFHLKGSCSDESCEYDHSPIDESTRDVLKYAVKNRPCNHNKQGACRCVDCDKGHICQKSACLHAGRRAKGCLIVRELHDIDHSLAKWVWPTEDRKMATGDKTNPNAEGDKKDNDDVKSVSSEDAPLIDL